MPLKQCRRCREFKATTEFCRKRRFSDGLNTWCRACSKESRASYYRRNRGREIAASTAWSRQHPEQARASVARAHSRHRVEYRAKAKERYASNPEPARARSAQWKRDNPARVAEQCGRRRARKLDTQSDPLDYREIWRRDEGTCHICGEVVEPSSVHFDHVVPLARGGTHTFSNVRVAHSRCNLVKGASV